MTRSLCEYIIITIDIHKKKKLEYIVDLKGGIY